MTNHSIPVSRYLIALDAWLVDCLDPGELRRFLDRSLGAAVLADLPSTGESPRAYIHDVVRVLARRGLLDNRLFAALAQERPHRARELQRLAAGLQVCVELDQGERDTVVWRDNRDAQGGREEWVEALEQRLLARERLDPGEPARIEIERAIDGLARRLRGAPMLGSGSVVAGTRLEKLLGAGNFGTVWRARQLSTGHIVATKIFHSDRLTDGVMLWRFRRSIRALQNLGRYRQAPPSIPTILAVAPDMLAFAMPYFPEGTLEHVDRRGWSLSTKLAVFLGVCRAVAFSHQVGVIHRDIKPANVLLDVASRPVLIDFDIADIRFVTQLSVAHGGLGTPVFAAPEQLEDAELADERSDIYSLGRLLHYLLLERSPGYQIERDPALTNLRGMPLALVSVVRKATQWDPRRRHDSVEQLIVEIERHQKGFAALRARRDNAIRWIRGHAALLTTCTTMVVASTTIATMEAELASSREEKLIAVNQQLAGHEKTLGDLDAATRRFVDLQASLKSLATTLHTLEDEARATPGAAALQGALEDVAVRAGKLDDDLVNADVALNSEISRLRGQQTNLRAFLDHDGVLPDTGSVTPPRPAVLPTTVAAPRKPPAATTASQVERDADHALALATIVHSEPLTAHHKKPDKRTKKRNSVPIHGDTEHLESIRRDIIPRIHRCIKEARAEDKSAMLTINVDVKPDGHIAVVKFSRPLQNSTEMCIKTALDTAEYQRTRRGDNIAYKII